MINPHITSDELGAVAHQLLAYCRSQGWAGHDPYDALNSRILSELRFLDTRVTRLVLTQALKRSPVNLRRFARIPRLQNPKALALAVAALVRMRPAEDASEDVEIASLVDRLIELRSPHAKYSCWGYSFPWQTRATLVPRGAPNLVCTSFVADALLDAYEASGDSRCLGHALSAAEYIRTELYWASESEAGFSYPFPGARLQIHNANLLGAALLCRAQPFLRHKALVDAALRVARYSASRQRADGSWEYGEGANQQWVDNFHTGYNLCALRSIGRSLATTEFEPVVARGLAFYRRHFIRPDGAPRYFHDRTYPIDAHAVAQTVITLVGLKDLHAGNVRLAHRVMRWALEHMWNDRGFFYYRVLRFTTIRTSYMRWSQAWMLLATATLLQDCSIGNKQITCARVSA